MGVRALLKQYGDNINELSGLDKTLYEFGDKASWQESIANRAQRVHDIYLRNNEIIEELKDYNPDDDTEVLDTMNAIHTTFLNGFDDAEVMIPLFLKCIEYAEKTNDTDKLIAFYSAMGYETTEYMYRSNGGKRGSLIWYEKVYNLEQTMTEFDERNQKNFLFNYYNILTQISDKKETQDDGLIWYRRLLSFIDKHVDLNNPKVAEIAYMAKTAWLVANDEIESASKETKLAFKEEAKEYYEKELYKHDNNIYAMDDQIFVSYIHSLAMSREITYNEMVHKLFDFYIRQKEFKKLDCYSLLNVPIFIEKHLGHVDFDLRKTIIMRLNDIINDNWDVVDSHDVTPFANEAIAQWCMASLKYMENKADKEQHIFRLLVKRQLPTFIHSYMVMSLALCIFDSMDQAGIAMFNNMGIDSKDVREYIRLAALLHDIGKTRICSIVSMNARKLSDYELGGIRQHPVYGLEMIEADPALSIYRDVVLGHHKYYNGLGGYPMDFDNISSRFKPVIDLIMICDCVDAATDHLGRNYKAAKAFDEVLVELVRDKGIKYNPAIVNFIQGNDRLIEELRSITDENRVELMHQAWETYNITTD